MALRTAAHRRCGDTSRSPEADNTCRVACIVSDLGYFCAMGSAVEQAGVREEYRFPKERVVSQASIACQGEDKPLH